MKKLVVLAAMLAMVLTVAAPALVHHPIFFGRRQNVSERSLPAPRKSDGSARSFRRPSHKPGIVVRRVLVPRSLGPCGVPRRRVE